MIEKHEHRWRTESTHHTSDGLVSYQRCGCGARRVAQSRPQSIATTTAVPRQRLASCCSPTESFG